MIGIGAFKYCRDLTDFKQLLKLDTVSEYAFQGMIITKGYVADDEGSTLTMF